MSKHNQRVFNKYFIILILGTVLWVAETAYFGFNAKAESGAEAALDTLAFGMIAYGLIGDLMRNVRVTKHYHNISTTRHTINTKKVEVTGEDQVVNNNYHINNLTMPKKGVKNGKNS